jgi:hypothetical protein
MISRVDGRIWMSMWLINGTLPFLLSHLWGKGDLEVYMFHLFTCGSSPYTSICIGYSLGTLVSCILGLE